MRTDEQVDRRTSDGRTDIARLISAFSVYTNSLINSNTLYKPCFDIF